MDNYIDNATTDAAQLRGAFLFGSKNIELLSFVKGVGIYCNYTSVTPSDKPDGKLQFSNEEKQISKLEKKADKYSVKLEKARNKLPSKIVEKPQLVFDEEQRMFPS